MKEIKKSFSQVVKSKDLKELTLELIEQIIDAQITDEVFQSLPIAKYLYGSVKIYNSITYRLFLKKSLTVLYEWKDVNWKDRMDFINELEGKGTSGIEKLMLSIDRIHTIEKCRVFGRLCKLKALNKISLEQFERLSFIIDQSYLPDFINTIAKLYSGREKAKKNFEAMKQSNPEYSIKQLPDSMWSELNHYDVSIGYFLSRYDLAIEHRHQDQAKIGTDRHSFSDKDTILGGRVKYTLELTPLGKLTVKIFNDLFNEVIEN